MVQALPKTTTAHLLSQSPKWLIKDKAAYKEEIWQFLEGGKAYQLNATRNGFGGVSIDCPCDNSRCRHFQAIQNADANRIAEENNRIVDSRLSDRST